MNALQPSWCHSWRSPLSETVEHGDAQFILPCKLSVGDIKSVICAHLVHRFRPWFQSSSQSYVIEPKDSPWVWKCGGRICSSSINCCGSGNAEELALQAIRCGSLSGLWAISFATLVQKVRIASPESLKNWCQTWKNTHEIPPSTTTKSQLFVKLYCHYNMYLDFGLPSVLTCSMLGVVTMLPISHIL